MGPIAKNVTVHAWTSAGPDSSAPATFVWPGPAAIVWSRLSFRAERIGVEKSLRSYNSVALSSTGLWSVKVKPQSMVCSVSMLTLSETMKPSIM